MNRERTDRRRHRLMRVAWIPVIVVLAAGVAFAAGRLAPHDSSSPINTIGAHASSAGSASGNSSFITVSGSSPKGLAPGVTRPVSVRVHNRSTRPVVVSSASIQVADASASCSAAQNIRATTYKSTDVGATRYLVRAGHTAVIPLSLTMLDLHPALSAGPSVSANQDPCQHESFPLTFLATARVG